MSNIDEQGMDLESLYLDPELRLLLPLRYLDGNSFMSRDAYGHLCTNNGTVWHLGGRSFDGI
ncbi:MAG: hypothetical protein SVY53_11925, partial [Chloroflexota bacterium]|nr:hypothetical protein [Chloroflexota bacterium]